MTRRALHLQAPRESGDGIDVRKAACGLPDVDLTESRVEVTCRRCKQQYKLALLAHLTEGLRERAEWVAPPAGPVVRGTTELTVAQERIARGPQPDDDEKPRVRWHSLKAAVQRWAAHVDEGASVKSSSAPSRFEGAPRGTAEGRVSNVERGVDDTVGVGQALAAAFVGGLAWGDVVLSAELCRELYVWRLAGRPNYSSAKRVCVQRHDTDTEELRLLACKVSGCEVTARHIALVTRAGNEQVRSYLEASGELQPQRRVAA